MLILLLKNINKKYKNGIIIINILIKVIRLLILKEPSSNINNEIKNTPIKHIDDLINILLIS
ncbi:hypothetical protein AM1H77_04650 [Apilactobacillus micheneri]